MRGIVRRYAAVRGARSGDEVRAYLPDNYRLDGVAFEDDRQQGEGDPLWGGSDVYVISGVDDHGWTLDGYVRPRLASGSMSCEEIDLSHPLMRQIEEEFSKRASLRPQPGETPEETVARVTAAVSAWPRFEP